VEFLPYAPDKHDDENRALISVPLDGDLDRVVAEIRSGLGREMRARRAPRVTASRAKYQVLASPRLSALDKQLRIYRFRAKYAEMTKVEIAYEVGMLKPTDSSFNPESVTAQVSGYYKDDGVSPVAERSCHTTVRCGAQICAAGPATAWRRWDELSLKLLSVLGAVWAGFRGWLACE
jgi:hypothetical protein